jgi:hypothetical protein
MDGVAAVTESPLLPGGRSAVRLTNSMLCHFYDLPCLHDQYNLDACLSVISYRQCTMSHLHINKQMACIPVLTIIILLH